MIVTGSPPVSAKAAPRHAGVTVREDGRVRTIVTGGRHAVKGTTVGATVTTTTTFLGCANFQVGYDYTQNSHLPSGAGGDPAAVASAESLLTSMDTFQNVALMGWGSDDPEPSPGVF